MTKLADVLHLVLVGVAVAVAAVFAVQTAKVDPWAWTILGSFGLGALAALQLISSREPPDGDLKKESLVKAQQLARALGIWTTASTMRRLLTYAVLAALVAATWFVGPRQLRQFGFDCEGASQIQLTSGDDLKCDNATRQRLWVVRQNVTAGGLCVWSDAQTQRPVKRPLSISESLLRCESCRLRYGADCVSRPRLDELKLTIGKVVRDHARKNAVLARLGNDPRRLEVKGHAKPLGQVLVEIDGRLSALKARLSAAAGVGEVAILTGPGGSGKGPVMRYLPNLAHGTLHASIQRAELRSGVRAA